MPIPRSRSARLRERKLTRLYGPDTRSDDGMVVAWCSIGPDGNLEFKHRTPEAVTAIAARRVANKSEKQPSYNRDPTYWLAGQHRLSGRALKIARCEVLITPLSSL